MRRIAKDNNLDLRQIAGTGSNGRITKEDVLRTWASTALAAHRRQQQSFAPPEVPGDLVPMTRMRSIIAQRMAESVRTSPHVHTVYKVDMTRIVRLREREKASFLARNGINLTYMPFIAAAAIDALRKLPIVNAPHLKALPSATTRTSISASPSPLSGD